MSALLPALLLASAVADPAVQLTSLVENGAPPAVVVVCSPIGQVADSTAEALVPLRTGLEASGNLEDGARKFLSLLGSEELSAAGLDVSGSLVVRAAPFDELALRLEVPFSGNRQQVEALLARIPDLRYTVEGEVWLLANKDKTPTPLRLQDGKLVVEKRQPPREGTPPRLNRALYRDLPGGGGCAMYMDMANIKEEPPKKGPKAVSFFLPMGKPGGETRVRVALVEELDLPLSRSKGRPVLGTSTETPMSVFTLSVSPNKLISAISQQKNAKELPKDVKKLLRRLKMKPGASMALYSPDTAGAGLEAPGPLKGMHFALVMPVSGPLGLPLSGKRLISKVIAAQGTEKGDGAVGLEQTGPLAVTLTMKDKPLYLRTARNRIYMSSSMVKADELASGQGKPWAGEEHVAQAKDWPVAVSGQVPNAMLPGVNAFVGLRMRENVLEVGMDMGSQTSTTMVAGMVAAIAVPNFIQMQLRAKRSEVPTTVEAIATAEMAYHAEYDRYLALPIAPRAQDALDKEKVPFVASEAWETLGYSPDGEVRGVYWVEVDEKGESYEVHGMADLDGDGTPCHFVKREGTKAEMITPKEVY